MKTYDMNSINHNDCFLIIFSFLFIPVISFTQQQDIQFKHLSVEDGPDCAVFIRHGLFAAGEIDNREPSRAESNGSLDRDALGVRPSVDDGLAHVSDHLGGRRRCPSQGRDSDDSAHQVSKSRIWRTLLS